ncbi:MAG: stage III sporulation protein AB [Faecousia sp.]
MNWKLMGAILVVAGCGGLGFYMALSFQREVRALRDLLGILDYISCELQYRMTALPELCKKAGNLCGGCIGRFFLNLSGELSSQISPNVQSCTESAMRKCKEIPSKSRGYLLDFGKTLGLFDLDGQLKGIEAVRVQIERELRMLEKGQAERLRGYQTLGLCAGAALAILLI